MSAGLNWNRLGLAARKVTMTFNNTEDFDFFEYGMPMRSKQSEQVAGFAG